MRHVTLHQAATHCNTLQHTLALASAPSSAGEWVMPPICMHKTCHLYEWTMAHHLISTHLMRGPQPYPNNQNIKRDICIWKEPYKRDPHCKCKQTCIVDLLTLSWTSHTVIIHKETYIHHSICRHQMRGPRPCPNSQTGRLSLRFLGLSKSNLVHPGCACVYVYVFTRIHYEYTLSSTRKLAICICMFECMCTCIHESLDSQSPI